jgi:hypothetical protein
MKTLNENTIVMEILNQEEQTLSVLLNIPQKHFADILQYSIVAAEMSGHYNKIFIVHFLDKKNILIGTICIKYSDLEIMNQGLVMETDVLNILHTNNIPCPVVISTGNLSSSHKPYIVMDVTNGRPAAEEIVDLDMASSVLRVIMQHEIVLHDHLKNIPSLSKFENIEKYIDYNEKIAFLMNTIVPTRKILESLDFLNEYLNDPYIMDHRILTTDRSNENIFFDKNGMVTLIDFSTLRIGSLFDNWIQFIDDPRAHFSCNYRELVELFFKTHTMSEMYMNHFYVASIYTNLLQGIFNYERNRKLAMSYFEKVNQAYSNLNNKKSMLIEINP